MMWIAIKMVIIFILITGIDFGIVSAFYFLNDRYCERGGKKK